MKISVISEISENEKRVSIVPDSVSALVKKGHQVFIVDGAGKESGYTNEMYSDAGAKIIKDNEINQSDICIYTSIPKNLNNLSNEQLIISNIGVRNNPGIIEKFTKKSITAFDMALIPRISRAQRMDVLSSQASIAGYKSFSLELLPRITRAQSMDVLSSQANLAGYRAVIESIYEYQKAVPMMMTAAGTVPPAKILILGAGVAGLQAIATAKRLGAIVFAFDVRLAAGEQIESLGANFIHPDKSKDAETESGYAKEQGEDEQIKQRKFLSTHLQNIDAIITTAAIPGKKAPLLITKEMLRKMRPGTVIVDLATESGGNVEINDPGKSINFEGVKIISPINIPSSMPKISSDLYSRNVLALLELITDKENNLSIDLDDEIIKSICIVKNGNKLYKDAN